ncbi:para-nitrobenzyl esterase [Marinobacter daqiaonensis]|uniref:Carboxylic ester hydrolase n=1 Tax=Marinobacter daqiaonensis TaxID=650891 RepID=A0A1I6JN72_9GAMM|nr:carboxylesterase family protein [Marinobacter daqiaonensis]SFR80387.1 para-nitrobenzyl esterase [Marinobacter daqiaonensis]
MQHKYNKPWQLALCAVLGSVILSGCGSSDSDDESTAPVRETQAGAVQGVEVTYGYAFKGIPYAQPPVGELRYADPVPAEAWEDTLIANEFGGACIQPASTFGTAESFEDCLYLNVYTPKDAENRPVMVWIHGGAFETGSGGASYTPSGLLEQDTVVVTLNYRMGVLGFLSHPDLAADGPSGSYGIMDQQLALQWVQDNIANFGGDPNNITIFGESAGGASVMTHVASPAATNLFHKAIVQSGAYIGVVDQPTEAEIAALGEAFYTALGCEDIACIRGLSAEDILAAQQASGFSYVPSLRSDILPSDVKTTLAEGSYNKVPVLAGSNLDEGRLFVGIAELGRINAALEEDKTYEEAAAEAALKPEDYRDQVAALVPSSLVDTVISLYPLSNYENTSVAVSAINTDSRFACPSLPQVQQLATGGQMVYAYEFTDRDAPSIIPEGNTFDLGAAHAFEIQYIFGSRASREARGMNAASLDLADAMTAYWARFAENGNPNSSDGTGTLWENLQANGNMLELDPEQIDNLSAADFAQRHVCALWNQSGS